MRGEIYRACLEIVSRASGDGVCTADEAWHIKRRIAELTPMLTQMNELAELTAHYYDKGYYRSEKYTL